VKLNIPLATQSPQVIRIPQNTTNTFRLAKLFNLEPHTILTRLQQLTREPYTDEFQLLSTDAIETMALEFDKEIELYAD